MGKQAQAELQPDGKYKVTHADGSEETLTEKQFHERYDVEDETKAVEGESEHLTPEEVRPDTLPPAEPVADRLHPSQVRPETTDADDAHIEDSGEFASEYADAVEAELKELEDGIKEVRAELKSVKGGKVSDFGGVRAAMHRLSHGKSLLRTAHVATIRHDGPERLREAPDPTETISSGPSEETNVEALRHFGR